jgi:hypothetical protein
LSEFWKLTRIPFPVAFRKVLARIFKKSNINKAKKNLLEIISQEVPDWFSDLETGYFTVPDKVVLEHHSEKLKQVGEHILNHRFNLLGTGWISRNTKLSLNEILDKLPDFWKAKARFLLTYLNEKNYNLIDFWSNPVNNFVWEPTFHKEIKIELGNDIKHPWELGRMQHLPVLAYNYKLFHDSNPEFARLCIEEFQNQILNFIAVNPVGYTVQWRSPMDVGIRMVNWLVSFDMFKSCGCLFDELFLKEFLESVYKHLLFILQNLEWSDGLRGNHYFANIVSLIFAGAYLPNCNFTSQILAFGLQELLNETEYQFFSDGGNFESSTYYHIQTAEMLLFALYILNSLTKEKVFSLSQYTFYDWKCCKRLKKYSKQKFSVGLDMKIDLAEDFKRKICKIVEFAFAIRKPNGEIEQIGDTDSGYFIRLNYFFNDFLVFEENYENVLNRDILDKLVECLSGDVKNAKARKTFFSKSVSANLALPKPKIVVLPTLFAFPNFGIYIVKSVYYYLTFRCGDIGQNGKGGHSHNDQLSITLFAFGKDFIVDPGTYCYTCSAEERNLFRSTKMHNTIVWQGKEQNLLRAQNPDDLFWIYKHRTRSRLIYTGQNKIVGEHYAYPRACRREVGFELNRIEILDTLNLKGEKLIFLHLHPNVEVSINGNIVYFKNGNVEIVASFPDTSIEIEDCFYSPQYGLKIPSKKLVYRTMAKEIKWTISLEPANV